MNIRLLFKNIFIIRPINIKTKSYKIYKLKELIKQNWKDLLLLINFNIGLLLFKLLKVSLKIYYLILKLYKMDKIIC